MSQDNVFFQKWFALNDWCRRLTISEPSFHKFS